MKSLRISEVCRDDEFRSKARNFLFSLQKRAGSSASENKTFLAFLVFIFVHILLFNINASEWGDSYRILRSAEYLGSFVYPSDEKRPPLFAVLLALRPDSIDQIFWGRIVVLLFSIASFYIFLKLLNLYIKSEKYKVLALLLFTFNPVFLYWSLRVMTDVVFSFFVLTSLYLFSKNIKTLSNFQAMFIAFLVYLSVLTRFEGYILLGSLVLAFLLRKDVKKTAYFLLTFIILMIPYLILRNPLNSKYFNEAVSRTYGLNTIAIYIVSVISLFGFIPAIYFLYASKNTLIKFLKNNIHITSFLIIELVLIIAWPAAIPRLFMPIIPFGILVLVFGIEDFFESTIFHNSLVFLIISICLLVTYTISQYHYRLQFLVPNALFFIAILLLQLFVIFFTYKKNFRFFTTFLIVSVFTWSIFTVWSHKDVFKTITEASNYAQKNLKGRIAYNDVSSVADWYLNQKDKNDQVEGIYYDVIKRGNSDFDKLVENKFDYLLVTNEHNTDLTFNTYNRDYLEQVVDFKYRINGKMFFASIYEVRK